MSYFDPRCATDDTKFISGSLNISIQVCNRTVWRSADLCPKFMINQWFIKKKYFSIQLLHLEGKTIVPFSILVQFPSVIVKKLISMWSLENRYWKVYEMHLNIAICIYILLLLISVINFQNVKDSIIRSFVISFAIESFLVKKLWSNVW